MGPRGTWSAYGRCRRTSGAELSVRGTSRLESSGVMEASVHRLYSYRGLRAVVAVVSMLSALSMCGCGMTIGYVVGRAYDNRRSGEQVEPTAKELRQRIGECFYITQQANDRHCGCLKAVSASGDSITVESCEGEGAQRLPGSPGVTGTTALAQVRRIETLRGSAKGKRTGTIVGLAVDVCALATLFILGQGAGSTTN
jgi:hypothetical protein